MNIGIAGTGRMGSAIAARLIGLGHTLTVWNRTPEKTRAAVAKALAGKDTGPANFDLNSMRKDLRTMLEEAQGLGGELPTAARVLEAFDRAAQAGHGSMDGVRIPAWVSAKGAA